MNNPEPTVSTVDPQASDRPRTTDGLSGRSDAPAPGADGTLPVLSTDLSPDEVIARLRKRSQQGKLPGFEHRGGHVFRVLCFGQPYDKELIGSVAPCEERQRGACVRFHTRLLRRMPTIMIVVMVLTIWPGVWVTHSLIAAYWYSYPDPMWVTAAWYIPLCLIAIPALWKQYKRSVAAADAHSHDIVQGIANVLDAHPPE